MDAGVVNQKVVITIQPFAHRETKKSKIQRKITLFFLWMVADMQEKVTFIGQKRPCWVFKTKMSCLMQMWSFNKRLGYYTCLQHNLPSLLPLKRPCIYLTAVIRSHCCCHKTGVKLNGWINHQVVASCRAL